MQTNNTNTKDAEGDSSVMLELLKDIKGKVDKTDDAISQMAGAIQTLAITLAKLEESHASMQKQQMLQKEVDEYQNHKIETAQADIHVIEKDIIPLKSSVATLEKKVYEMEKEIKIISVGQAVDNNKWSGLGSFTSKILIPLLLATIIGLSSYLWYNSTGGKP